MAFGVSTFGYAAAPHAAPAATCLQQRRDLPTRVRNLLAGLLSQCSHQLVRLLGATLDEFEQELTKRAAAERDNERRQRLYESLRQVQRSRISIGPKFLAALEQGLAGFDRSAAGDDRQPGSELSLVEARDLEEALAVQEIAARSDTRHLAALHDLGHRFGVLAAGPAFEIDRVPLGPGALLAALRETAQQANVPTDHRLLLYPVFDRVAMAAIAPFYASLNSYLAGQRILKFLRVHAPPRKRSKDGTAVAAAAAPHSAPEPLPSAGSAGPQGDPADAQLFATLRNLLAAGQPARAAATAPAAGRYVPSADDLQSVLGLLQTPAPPAAGAAASQRTQQLKQDLLGHLQRFAPPGKTPQLDSEDADTIDLVGLLFEQIADTAPARGSTRGMLGQLQVPLMRVALRDKGFFTQRAHPARLLLNAIAETGIHWIDDADGEADPVLQKKMHSVIQRLNTEFDGSLSLIERMLGDLTQHMNVLQRKAALTEKHLVDASRGREKLAIARQTASRAISARIGAAKPGRLLRTMLEQAWTDVLALNLLRHSEDGETYRRQLAIADQLIAAGAAGRDRTSVADATLRREVEQGLAQVGFHPDEIHAVVGHLLADGSASTDENPTSQTEVALRLKSKAHLGEPGHEERSAAGGGRKAPAPPNAEEVRALAQITSLPFGTWFEFAVNQQGDRVRRKLSWYSTVTGRCLFVNPRGARAFERTLQQLAHDVVRGEANIAPPERESLVDRAWKTIVASLRQLTARAADSQPMRV